MEKDNYKKAQELFKAQQFKEALVYFDKVIADNPTQPDYYSDRAVTYFHLQQLKKALQDADKAVELQPGYSYRYASRAYIMERMGKIDAAIADYEKAVQLDPDDAIAYNNLGLLLEKKGRMEAAKRSFSKADELAEDWMKSTNAQINQHREEAEKDPHLPGPDQGTPLMQSSKQTETEEEQPSKTQVAKEVFTKKETFKEFIKFIKNGFKMKDDQ